jgi:hypothetical protein
MTHPCTADLMRVAAGLGELAVQNGNIVYQPHKLPPHTKEVEMNLLRTLDTLNGVARATGWIICTDRNMPLAEVPHLRIPELDVRPVKEPA